MSASTLIETVNINLEDFSDSFLTCSTCLCPYDLEHRRAKLLPCSHSVCSLCLQSISQLPQSESGTLRCPLCRELNALPRAGVQGLPPSFLINQLMDLLGKQRRDLVPKCSAHPNEHLLFCETCSTVFCPLCTQLDTSAQSPCREHTIVGFAVALKRMGEIVLYKAQQCVKNLNRAQENVARETAQLDSNVDVIIDQINSSFQELSVVLESRRRQLIDDVRAMRDDKRKVLADQLVLIQEEKAGLERECVGLQSSQVEIRDMSRRIGELNDRMQATTALIEPRENAFLRLDTTTAAVVKGIESALQGFGQVSASRTFPSLCRLKVLDDACVHVECHLLLVTYDVQGVACSTGGDPVSAHMVPVTATGLPGNMGSSTPLRLTVSDNDNGSYTLAYRVAEPGDFDVSVLIFGRAVGQSPFRVHVGCKQASVWQFGSEGCGSGLLRLPVKVLIDATDRLVYVLDTGNSRVVAVDDGGTVVREVTGEALGGTAVGMALLGGTLPELVTLNWRDRILTKWSSGGLPVQSVSFSELVEPTDVVVDSRGRIILLDNGAGKVFVFDAGFRPLFNFVVPSMSSLTCLAVGLNDDLLIGTSGGGLLLFDGGGRFLRTISTAPNGSKESQRVAACAVDRVSGLVVFASDGRGATLGVSHYKGSFAFAIRGARLHRPSGLCIGLGDHSNLCYVTDLHTHSIRSFRFK